ncbi:TPA: nitrate reductase molybdenum cofactor assembly chaperone [Aeromonas veronii]
MKSLKIISILLDYPDIDLWENKDEIFDCIAECNELTSAQKSSICDFVTYAFDRSLLSFQEIYCDIFDRGRSTSLLLFEHVHGESRDRGQAMVDLLKQYEDAGFSLNKRELPDFLPVYLEYLSTRNNAEIIEGLCFITPILGLLKERLLKRESKYHVLFGVLIDLSMTEYDSAVISTQVMKEADDATPAALDAVWEEEQVKFLGGESCPSSIQSIHSNRFKNAVVPQYLEIGEANK